MTICPVDGWTAFHAVPTPCLLLTAELVICEANHAYLRATHRAREELVGRPMFEAFPDNPDDPEAGGVAALRASLQRVLETGAPDTMAVQRYDIVVPTAGDVRWEQRWWSPVNAPVLDGEGRTVAVVHRVEDVTDLMRQLQDTDSAASALRERVTTVEADLVARGRELQRANERLWRANERERHVALTLQEAMLPEHPSVEAVDLAVRYLPATDHVRVGGEWYDMADLGGGCVAVMVGDVVGHGLAAAGVMGQMRSALSAAVHAQRGPAAALETLDTFSRSVGGGFVATALCAVIDVAAGRVTYSIAGHPPPLLIDDGSRFLDEAAGPGLGVLSEPEKRPEAQADLGAGGLLVAYTDGLVERRGEDLGLGLDRLRAAAEAVAAAPVDEVADGLLDALLPKGKADDDVALVVVRR